MHSEQTQTKRYYCNLHEYDHTSKKQTTKSKHTYVVSATEVSRDE
jgi:hypothetical protein